VAFCRHPRPGGGGKRKKRKKGTLPPRSARPWELCEATRRNRRVDREKKKKGGEGRDKSTSSLNPADGWETAVGGGRGRERGTTQSQTELLPLDVLHHGGTTRLWPEKKKRGKREGKTSCAFGPSSCGKRSFTPRAQGPEKKKRGEGGKKEDGKNSRGPPPHLIASMGKREPWIAQDGRRGKKKKGEGKEVPQHSHQKRSTRKKRFFCAILKVDLDLLTDDSGKRERRGVGGPALGGPGVPSGCGKRITKPARNAPRSEEGEGKRKGGERGYSPQTSTHSYNQ